MSALPSAQFLIRSGEPALAYHRYLPEEPAGPGVVFLGGFRSDMQGTKALYLEEVCRHRRQPYIRFDYRGHGESEGQFKQATISTWLQDVLDIIDQLTTGRIILVGSSMGGWLSLLALRARPERIAGVVGIATAPDFTRDIWQNRMTDQEREVMTRTGFLEVPNHYSAEPYIITKALIDDGPQHYILENYQSAIVPIRLIQGRQDQDVPWETAFKLQQSLQQGGNHDVDVMIVEEGDHRLSRPEDLALIDTQIAELSYKMAL